MTPAGRCRISAAQALRSSSAPAAAGRARAFPLERANPDRPLARVRCLPRRRHRLAQARGAAARRRDASTITDLGSLNGTFVNKKRIETAELEDDDEVQIGKYRLTFLRR